MLSKVNICIKCKVTFLNIKFFSVCTSWSSYVVESSVLTSHCSACMHQCSVDISSPQFPSSTSLYSLEIYGVRVRENLNFLCFFSGVSCATFCLCPLCTFKPSSVWVVYSKSSQEYLLPGSELDSTSVVSFGLSWLDQPNQWQ